MLGPTSNMPKKAVRFNKELFKKKVAKLINQAHLIMDSMANTWQGCKNAGNFFLQI